MSDSVAEPSTMALSSSPIFPAELVTLISTFLADSSSLRTISQLNRVSKAVNQETLAVLYETLVYKCVPSFARTVDFKVLPGWKSTRNLLLIDTTMALLLQHIRFMDHLELLPEPTLEQAFPKLELMAVTDSLGSTKLTLLKPLSLAGILERLHTDRHRMQTLFGTTIDRKATPEASCCPGCHRSLDAKTETTVGLEFRDGAYLLPDTSGGVIGFHALDPANLISLSLDIHEPPKNPVAWKESIKQILRCFQRAQEKNPKVKDMTLHLKAPAEWYAIFIEALQEVQPMHCNISAAVLSSTFTAMRQIVTSLGDVYATHWSPSASATNLRKLFVIVTSPLLHPSVPPDQSLIIDQDFKLLAALVLGHDDVGENGGAQHRETGFAAKVLRVHSDLHTHRQANSEGHRLPDMRFHQAFPCEAAYEAAERVGGL